LVFTVGLYRSEYRLYDTRQIPVAKLMFLVKVVGLLIYVDMAQFVVVPPLDRVSRLFCTVTACKFAPEVSWNTWSACDASCIEWLREYIRPSHQKLLNETISGEQRTQCSLLRQVLRPHDYRIEKTSYGWTLKQGKHADGPKVVAVKPGRRIIWNEE
jgi:hypothetical protein